MASAPSPSLLATHPPVLVRASPHTNGRVRQTPPATPCNRDTGPAHGMEDATRATITVPDFYGVAPEIFYFSCLSLSVNE